MVRPKKRKFMGNQYIDTHRTPKKERMTSTRPATRWGIAGAGKISHDFCVALRTLPESEHKIVGVAARQLSRAQEFAKVHGSEEAYGSYEELAKDPSIEVVYIGTLNPQHLEIAKLMLSNGKHVLCEKPLTLNLKQSTELINFAKSKGLFLMEAIWSRCFPAYEAIKKEIQSGRIGEIKQLIVPFGFKLTEIERMKQKSLGGGTILDLGVYTLQFTTFIFGLEEPISIKASGSLNSDGVDLSMSATLLYKGGRTSTILTNAQVDMPNEAFILGTKGTIRVPHFWCPPKAELPSGTFNAPLPEGDMKINFVNSTGLSYEAAEVRRCILAGLKESPKVTHEESLFIAKLQDELRKQIGVVYPAD